MLIPMKVQILLLQQVRKCINKNTCCISIAVNSLSSDPGSGNMGGGSSVAFWED